jgi:hypothetical protein
VIRRVIRLATMIAIWRLGGKLSSRVGMALKAAAEYLESGQGNW